MIIKNGRLVANDAISAIEESENRDAAIDLVVKGDYTEAVAILQRIPGIQSFVPIRGKIPGTVEARVLSAGGADPREAIFFAFAERKFPILNMHREVLTIEDIFLRLTEDREAAEQAQSTKRKGE